MSDNISTSTRYQMCAATLAELATAAATDLTVTSLDMRDYERATVTVVAGAVVSTSVTTIQWQESDNNSTWSDVGSAVTLEDDTTDLAVYISECKAEKRYLRAAISRGTANATILSAMYEQHHPRREPVDSHGTSVSASIARP